MSNSFQMCGISAPLMYLMYSETSALCAVYEAFFLTLNQPHPLSSPTCSLVLKNPSENPLSIQE